LYNNLKWGGYCYAGISAVDPAVQGSSNGNGDNPF